MTIHWTETTTDTTASSRKAHFDPDLIVDDIHTRRWSRERRGSDETVTAWIAVGRLTRDDPLWSFLVRWDYDRRVDGTAADFWASGAARLGAGQETWRGLDAARAAADLDPQLHLPPHCPAWAWDFVDVAEYRGLSGPDSARRWVNEQQPDIRAVGRHLETGAKLVDGHDVVSAAAAMVGRGKGGGRPRVVVGGDREHAVAADPSAAQRLPGPERADDTTRNIRMRVNLSPLSDEGAEMLWGGRDSAVGDDEQDGSGR